MFRTQVSFEEEIEFMFTKCDERFEGYLFNDILNVISLMLLKYKGFQEVLSHFIGKLLLSMHIAI